MAVMWVVRMKGDGSSGNAYDRDVRKGDYESMNEPRKEKTEGREKKHR